LLVIVSDHYLELAGGIYRCACWADDICRWLISSRSVIDC